MTSGLGDVAGRLVPRIYGASELGVLSLTAPGALHPRVEYVGGELFVGLDTGDGPVTQGQAEALAEPFDVVVAAAIADAGDLPEARGGGVVVEDETVAASLLVRPERTADLALRGAPLVFALSRTRVVVAGADDEAAVGQALALAEELYEGGGPLVSAHPVVLVDGVWAPLRVSDALPALALPDERVLRLFSVRAYEAQGVVLQRPDVHIADPKLHVRDDGVTLTFATWPKDTATLLPVVDDVIVADPSGSLSVATMGQFLDAAGDAVVPTGLSPMRYFVPGEPPR